MVLLFHSLLLKQKNRPRDSQTNATLTRGNFTNSSFECPVTKYYIYHKKFLNMNFHKLSINNTSVKK